VRHLKKGRKFGRERNQRKALMKSLASSFFMLGRIVTTEAKAKELKPYVEKFISLAKNPNLVRRRQLGRFFSDKAIKGLIEHASEMKERPGGYTRIVKMGVRKRDGARMALLELVK